MLDIIAMILLAMYNGRIAQQNGLKAGTWRLYTVVAWIIGELVGTAVALQFYKFSDFLNPKVSFKIMLLVIPFAFAGFHFVHYQLKKQISQNSKEF